MTWELHAILFASVSFAWLGGVAHGRWWMRRELARAPKGGDTVVLVDLLARENKQLRDALRRQKDGAT